MTTLEISTQLKQFRISKGITQTQLANKINVSQQHIAMIETGKHNLRMDTLLKLCDALELTIEVK